MILVSLESAGVTEIGKQCYLVALEACLVKFIPHTQRETPLWSL